MLRLQKLIIFGTAVLSVAVATAVASPASAQAGLGTDRSPNPMIIGGHPADLATTPWFVQLTPRIGVNTFLCGGTAVTTRWVVTAAHCVVQDIAGTNTFAATTINSANPSYVQVDPPERNGGTQYDLQDVVVHPGYDPNDPLSRNDIALVRTVIDMPTTPATLNPTTTVPAINAPLEVYGFGTTSNGGFPSDELLVASVLDIGGPSGPCGGYGSVYDPATQLCAGVPGGGIDSCEGDSGGPLMGGGLLVGIVSTGRECALPDYPGIYTRISAFAPWIGGYTALPLAHVHVTKRPCKKNICSLKKGGKLHLTVANTGTATGQFGSSGGRVKVTPGKGSLVPQESARLLLTTKFKKKRCVAVVIAGTGSADAKYKIRLNGARC